MGNEIVEKLARIIDPTAFKAWQSAYDYCLAQDETDEVARGYADWSQKAACDEALAKARKILAALREPSDAMLRSVDNEASDKFVARGRAYSAWTSMIDTALTEGTEHDQG